MDSGIYWLAMTVDDDDDDDDDPSWYTRSVQPGLQTAPIFFLPGGQDLESLPQVTCAEGCLPGHLGNCSLHNHVETKQKQKQRAALSKFSADHS